MTGVRGGAPGTPDLRRAGALASIGTTMVACTVVGLAAGYWLDKWLGTEPWLLLLFLMLGIVSGFVSMIQTALRHKPRTRRTSDRASAGH